ncbi:hypothetical protein IOR21_000867 [Escherichia coli]|uniref:hypothetical protein n=3 Tax=Escherichia TaxID=561 RepID=UPI000B7CE029|nr:hypothetical protein [Escherichia coli]EEY5776817.1 hypothetical protein [Escherichia coli]EFA6040592.1 hypothetical protein [Escherichia coli]EFB4328643.1 hypothetical protein [Escherichia coli]EFB4352095.1 hypothetical protein [Escherichia coli]EFB6645397.1 hypothetical protein [Escherichia coli]
MCHIEIFREALTVKDPIYIYRKYLLGHDVWYFRNKLGKLNYAEVYDDLKILMSERLGVHINNVAIVGSAKLGFSITPTEDKAFREFNEDSDIDIVVVSPELFRKSWDAYLDVAKRQRIPYYYKITSNIFRKFVSLKNIDYNNEFFRDWKNKIEPCQKDLQVIYEVPNEINYRIYESWEDVERYHVQGLEKLKNLMGQI